MESQAAIEPQHPPAIQRFIDMLTEDIQTKRSELTQLEPFLEYVKEYSAVKPSQAEEAAKQEAQERPGEARLRGLAGPVCSRQAFGDERCTVQGCLPGKCLLGNCPLSLTEILAIEGRTPRERTYRILCALGEKLEGAPLDKTEAARWFLAAGLTNTEPRHFRVTIRRLLNAFPEAWTRTGKEHRYSIGAPPAQTANAQSQFPSQSPEDEETHLQE